MLYHRSLRRILLLIVLLIVYGSFYPWQFVPKHVPGSVFYVFLHSWHKTLPRFVLRDTFVNVCLYIPVGFAAHFVFRKRESFAPGFYWPILLGMCLSISVELGQLYTPARDTSMLDVIANTAGSAVGVILACVFEKIAGPRPPRVVPRMPSDRGALMLVFCWIAWLFVPLFPVLGSYLLIRKAHAFMSGALLEPMVFLSAAAIWFGAGLLLAPAGFRRPLEWLAVSILAVPAWLFISGRQPTPSDLLGAIAGLLLFAFRPRMKPVAKPEAWAFLAVVVLRGLSPFHFVPESSGFTWVPFGGVLGTDWQFAVFILLGKIFYYTAAVWLLRAAGMRLWRATVTVAALLGVIEVAQIHLPGRTPETMDPLLTIVMGFMLFILSRETGRRFRSAE